jgi:Triosephosphate isomerase
MLCVLRYERHQHTNIISKLARSSTVHNSCIHHYHYHYHCQQQQYKSKMKFLISCTVLALLSGTGSSFVAPRVTTPIIYGSATISSSWALLAERQPIMAGNWKMNPATEDEALALATDVATLLGKETCAVGDSDTVDEDSCTEVVIFPPFPFISKVKDSVEEAGLVVGAQNFFFEDSGAFTGSVSASMVKSVGCEYVLCGHSERRTLFKDSDVNINQKVGRVLQLCWLELALWCLT